MEHFNLPAFGHNKLVKLLSSLQAFVVLQHSFVMLIIPTTYLAQVVIIPLNVNLLALYHLLNFPYKLFQHKDASCIP